MKNHFVILIIVLVSITITAQETISDKTDWKIKIGVTAGLVNARFAGEESRIKKGKTGLCIGTVVESFKTGLGFSAGIQYIQKGGSENYVDAEISSPYNLFTGDFTVYNDYVEFPILAKYSIPLQSNIDLALLAGGVFGLNLNAKYEYNGTISSPNPDGSIFTYNYEENNKITTFPNYDYGIMFGTGFSYTLKDRSVIDFKVKYYIGSKTMVEVENVEIYNSYLLLTTSYYF